MRCILYCRGCILYSLYHILYGLILYVRGRQSKWKRPSRGRRTTIRKNVDGGCWMVMLYGCKDGSKSLSLLYFFHIPFSQSHNGTYILIMEKIFDLQGMCGNYGPYACSIRLERIIQHLIHLFSCLIICNFHIFTHYSYETKNPFARPTGLFKVHVHKD